MMKKFFLASSAAAMAAFGLIACGDESTINQITQEGIPQIAAGESLGKCSDKNVGEMFFVTDSSAVYYCADGKWKSLNGKDGDKGDKGESTSSVDTLIVNSKDTLIIRDTVVMSNRDTVIVLDTIVGLNGKDGKNCTFFDDGEGSITITCGEGDSVKTSTAYKALCGSTPYDPANKTCLDSRILCDSAAEGVVASAVNGGKFTCRSNKWDAATEMEIAINKGCVASIQGEQATFGYSNWVCRADSIGWVYDFEHINYGTITYAGQTYKTVGIGEQMWMAENLNYADSAKTPNLKGGSWCFMNNKTNCTKYGRLYSWTAAMDLPNIYLKQSALADGFTSNRTRGICPEGWHVPDTTEFRKLFNFAEKHKGEESLSASLKSTDWPDSTKNGVSLGVDRFGFSWRLSGFYTSTVSNKWSEVHAYFHLSTESREDVQYAYHAGVASVWDSARLAAIYPGTSSLTDTKPYGYSVRCLKDED